MFPFTYYIDCQGDLWVPCSCRCNGGGNGGEGIETAAARRARMDARKDERWEGRERWDTRGYDLARDYDLRREYDGRCAERICRASKAEECMLQREMGLDKMMDEILQAVKRLEDLHKNELESLAPGA